MSSDEPLTRRSIRSTSRKRSVPLRGWMLFACAVVLVVLAVAAIRVTMHAFAAKSDLAEAIPLAKQTETLILTGDSAGAVRTAQEFGKRTAAARSEVNGPLWSGVEWLPWLGRNLSVIRTLAETTDNLSHEALVPAASIDLDAFKPVDGRIDPQAIRRLATTVGQAKASVDSARDNVSHIGRGGLIAPVSSAVDALDTQLEKTGDIVDALDPIVRILPGALGANGARNYLMVFQGNSEIRGLGGNPAAFAVLQVNDGSINIVAQYNSNQFRQDLASPITTLPAEVEKVYSKTVGTYTPNITSTPDFPLTAQLALAYLKQVTDTHIDGVVSFDPVALSYLLSATGPVTLETGQTLTAQNAISLLLNQVYSIYPKSTDQNRFFAEAAASVFTVLTSGKGSPATMFAALQRAASEGRLLLWSNNPDEEKIFSSSRIGGVLPTSNVKQTIVGTYFNDVTGSKMDYFVKAKVSTTSNQCTNRTPTFTHSVTLSNLVTEAQIPSLPPYVTGPYYQPGDIGTDVIVYGPVGSTLSSWKVAGASAEVRGQGEIGGRPVLRVWVGLSPQQHATLSYTFKGAKGEYGPLEEQTTPMVWPTPATVTAPGCSKTTK